MRNRSVQGRVREDRHYLKMIAGHSKLRCPRAEKGVDGNQHMQSQGSWILIVTTVHLLYEITRFGDGVRACAIQIYNYTIARIGGSFHILRAPIYTFDGKRHKRPCSIQLFQSFFFSTGSRISHSSEDEHGGARSALNGEGL